MTQRKSETIYQLNVALKGSSPLIWRRIQASPRMTLPHLHRTLQIVMGWENYHLQEFRVAGKVYAEPDPVRADGMEHLAMRVNQASRTAKSPKVFCQARKTAEISKDGFYARLSTNGQQALPLQTHRALWVRNATSRFIFHFSTVSHVVDLKRSE